ncbi:hypothetical protein [Paracoccus salipaludis]|uniref:Uncharacterized protein n=1 Tax=Paracoccus salipaludis TaxID=2032623 RepID=A0A2A2GK31_9RHOB|nr:hypothetical protein [Paracoccus salipaludis]PAU97249.1 hypothetical protein CK240_09215 [Paracoccus salipaludis]
MRLAAWPNKAGILSDSATAVADVRHPDPMAVMAERVRRDAQPAAIAGCTVRIEDEWSWGGDIFGPDLVGTVRSDAVR